jgi:hypothetical protein
MEVAVFFLDYGRFHGGFASSSSQLFASVSHGGVLRVCFCFRSRYHTFGVLGVLYSSSSRKRRLSHHYDKKSNGSRVHEFSKEKEYRHIERLFGGTGGGCLFCDLGILDLLGGYMGKYLGVGRVGKDIVAGFLCCWGISESWYFRIGYGAGAG